MKSQKAQGNTVNHQPIKPILFESSDGQATILESGPFSMTYEVDKLNKEQMRDLIDFEEYMKDRRSS